MNRRTFIAATAAACCVPPARGASGLSLTAADVHPAKYPTVLAQQWLSSELERKSAGELRIKIYHSGQLGKESDTVDLVRLGALDITRVFSGGLNNALPESVLLGLPYLFRSVAHQRAVLDGPVGQSMLDALSTYKLKGLALYDSGARHFYARQPLLSPADLKGLKIRVPVSDLFIDVLRELGANPTPLAYGAVYSALETGLIDGAENNVLSFHSSRQFETAPHLSLSAHSYAPDFLVMSLKRWQALSVEQQRMIAESARESVSQMRAAWELGEQTAREELMRAKVQMHQVETEAFQARTRDLHQRYLSSEPLRALYRQIEQTS